MRGPEQVRNDIAAYLGQAVPLMVDKARTQWGMDIPTEPAFYFPYEPTGIDHNKPPIVAVSISSGGDFTTVDIDDWGAMEYRVTYNVSIFMWCATPLGENGEVPEDSREQSLRLRDQLATCIRAVLLQKPSLGHPDRYQTVEGSLREEYSEATPTGNASGRFISGSVHNITVKVDEKLDNTGDRIVKTPIGIEMNTQQEEPWA